MAKAHSKAYRKRGTICKNMLPLRLVNKFTADGDSRDARAHTQQNLIEAQRLWQAELEIQN